MTSLTSAAARCLAHLTAGALPRAWLLGILLATVGYSGPLRVARADAELCIAAHERAQVERLERHYLAARERLLVCAQRECPRLVSTDCTQWLSELDATLPTLVFAVSDDTGRDLLEARVLLNGQLVENHVDGHAHAVDPGVYTVRFEAEGYVASEHSLSVRDGEKSRLVRGALQPSSRNAARATGSAEVAPDRVDGAPVTDTRARRLRIASYTLGAAAVASFALTLASSLRGHAMLERCRDEGCSDDYAETGKMYYRTVNISAAVGGVLLATGAVTLLTSFRSGRRDERAGLRFGAHADAHSVQLGAWSQW